MKKKEFELTTTTDMKVFLLFLLDSIGYPLEHATIMEIVQENTDEISLDYDECLRQLVASEHMLYDEVGEERYYMISDKPFDGFGMTDNPAIPCAKVPKCAPWEGRLIFVGYEGIDGYAGSMTFKAAKASDNGELVFEDM